MTTRIAQRPANFRLLAISEQDLPDPISSQHRDAQRRTLRALTAIVRAGMASGVLRSGDAHVAAFGVLGMCNWVAWWFNPEHPDAPTLEQLVDDLASMGVAGLRLPDERTPEGSAGIAHAVDLLRKDLAYLEHTLEGVQDPR